MASYPTSAKVFTTKNPGDTILASTDNEEQDEITAIEQDLIAGLPVARGGTGLAAIGTALQVLRVNAGATALEFASGAATEQTTAATGAQADFAPSAGNQVVIRCTGAAPAFSGFTGGAAGRTLYLLCLGTTLKVVDQATSTAANQIICQTTAGLIVGVNGVIALVYDATTARWRAAILDPGSPITFTPTWTGTGSNPVINSGTLTGKYAQRGKTVWYEIRVVAAADTTFGSGTYSWALPLTASAAARASGAGYITDAATTRFLCVALYPNTTTVQAALDATISVASATVPMTWADTDQMTISGEYELP